MNVKRGIFRAWLAFSILWLVYWSWRIDLPCDLFGLNITGKEFGCGDAFAYPFQAYTEIAALLFGGPLIVGGVVALLFWVASGFKISN